MREQIHTIPVNEAFDAHDECPFCFMERKVEQSAIRFVAGPGASYMEPDVRGATDRAGFCVQHMQKLYTYGNSLGNGLMLQTYLACFLEDFQKEKEAFVMPEKKPLFGKRKQPVSDDPYWKRLRQKVESCYICDKIEYNMSRYYRTFFTLLKEPEFREKVEKSKGFCLCHFAQLLDYAREDLPNNQREWFYETVMELMKTHINRVKEDIDWFVQKHDYRASGAPWKNAMDAVPRGMQKLRGGHPSDKPYKTDF
jgi:hypothetical protein